MSKHRMESFIPPALILLGLVTLVGGLLRDLLPAILIGLGVSLWGFYIARAEVRNASRSASTSNEPHREGNAYTNDAGSDWQTGGWNGIRTADRDGASANVQDQRGRLPPAATNKRAIAIGIFLLVGFYFGPQVIEGTSTPCGALAMQRVESAQNYKHAVLGEALVHIAGDGIVRARVGKQYHTDHPELVCAGLYWVQQ